MRWSDIPFKPAAATLRRFGVLGALLLALAAGAQFFAHENAAVALVLLALAVVALAVGNAFPWVLRPVFVGWMVLVYPIRWLTSHLILAFLFYCMFTPLGLFFKLIGRDVLALSPSEQDTYWIDKPPAEDVRSYFRQS